MMIVRKGHNMQKAGFGVLFMVIGLEEYTNFTHTITVDEHSEKEISNKIESENGLLVKEDELILISEITKRIRQQIDPQISYVKLQIHYMVNEEHQLGILTQKRVWIRDI